MIVKYSLKKSLAIKIFFILSISTATVFRQEKLKIEPEYKKFLEIV